MLNLPSCLLTLSVLPTSLSYPAIPVNAYSNSPYRRDASDPASQLLHIMPSAASCPSSSGPNNECITAPTALPHLLSSFSRYQITTAGEQAAILSWIALESAELKYNINHFPGTPGQGTRVMLMPPYIAKYIASMPEMKAQADAAGGDVTKLLGLVLDDEHSLGSGAWFISSQCTEEVRMGLAGGSDAGWEKFITGCVGTTVTEQRRGYWVKAKEALGLKD